MCVLRIHNSSVASYKTKKKMINPSGVPDIFLRYKGESWKVSHRAKSEQLVKVNKHQFLRLLRPLLVLRDYSELLVATGSVIKCSVERTTTGRRRVFTRVYGVLYEYV
jgi:hypothetical protein